MSRDRGQETGPGPAVDADVGGRLAAIGTDVSPDESEMISHAGDNIDFRFVTQDGERHSINDGRIEIDGDQIQIIPEEIAEATVADAREDLEGMESDAETWVSENLDDLEDVVETSESERDAGRR